MSSPFEQELEIKITKTLLEKLDSITSELPITGCKAPGGKCIRAVHTQGCIHDGVVCTYLALIRS